MKSLSLLAVRVVVHNGLNGGGKTIWSFQGKEIVKSAMEKFCLFVCFVALRPKSTALAMAGRSVHLTTPSPGQA